MRTIGTAGGYYTSSEKGSKTLMVGTVKVDDGVTMIVLMREMMWG